MQVSNGTLGGSNRRVPSLRWAESGTSIFLTAEVAGARNVCVTKSGDATEFKFSCDAPQEQSYAWSAELLHEIVPEQTSWTVNDRDCEFVLVKKQGGYWKQLLKDRSKFKDHLRTDWQLYRDEELEADERNLACAEDCCDSDSGGECESDDDGDSCTDDGAGGDDSQQDETTHGACDSCTDHGE